MISTNWIVFEKESEKKERKPYALENSKFDVHFSKVLGNVFTNLVHTNTQNTDERIPIFRHLCRSIELWILYVVCVCVSVYYRDEYHHTSQNTKSDRGIFANL